MQSPTRTWDVDVILTVKWGQQNNNTNTNKHEEPMEEEEEEEAAGTRS